MKKKIILLSHEASLSGAPMSLLNLSKYLLDTKEYVICFLFNRSGPLIPEFKKIGKVICLDNLGTRQNIFVKYIIRVLPMYKIRDQLLKFIFLFYKPNCVISNTIVNSSMLSYFNFSRLKLLTIVREKKGVINLFDSINKNDSKKIINKSSKFIAVSNSVKKDLNEYYNVDNNKIQVIYNTLPYFKKQINSQVEINKWKKENNIPPKAFIVGSCGGPIWRKGPDLFLNIAKAVKKISQNEDIFFIWKGGKKNSSWFLDFVQEIKFLDLHKNITILPESKNIGIFYNSIDVYISTAREEPFGLTLLEAGHYKKPCLAFSKSGGPEEILSKDKGIIVPYGDIEKAANEIISLKNDEITRKKYSKLINEYANTNTSNENFKKYKKIIDSFI